MPSDPAVLLMAYGSPNSLDEVSDYLQEIRGRPVTPVEAEQLRERYRRVGGKTPLLAKTQLQATGLQQRLTELGIHANVYVGMKHWHPFIGQVVERIVGEGAGLVVGVAMAPHYSRLSIGGYEELVRKALLNVRSETSFVMVRSWHTQPALIRTLADRIAKGIEILDGPSRLVILFTAHSLPKRAVGPNDPYESQLRETSKLVAKEAKVQRWDFAFQSAGKPREEWLGPQIDEKILELSNEGYRKILVCPVGFVSDHLEILHDLDIEARNFASSLGVKMARTDSLNDDSGLIQALADVVKPILSVGPTVSTASSTR